MYVTLLSFYRSIGSVVIVFPHPVITLALLCSVHIVMLICSVLFFIKCLTATVERTEGPSTSSSASPSHPEPTTALVPAGMCDRGTQCTGIATPHASIRE